MKRIVYSLADIRSLMTSIGFTETEVTANEYYQYYFTADQGSNTHVDFFLSSGYIACTAYLSNGTAVASGSTQTSTNVIGEFSVINLANGGVAIGLYWTSSVSANHHLHYAVVAPGSNNDHYAYIVGTCATSSTAQGSMPYVDSNNVVVQQGTGFASLIDSTNSTQICKMYNGTRFLDNVFQVRVGITPGAHEVYKVTISNKNYLLGKFTAYGTRITWALEMATE